MRRRIGIWELLIVIATAAPANAQVISLLVGNQNSFNALDSYSSVTGQYSGGFGGPGTGPPGTFYFTYGPDGNLFVERSTNPNTLLQYNGVTGAFINTFVPTTGGGLTFGPDGNLYRLEDMGTTVRRYNGTTGQLIGTFISSNLVSGQPMRFGPNGDLFIGDGPIKRFNGTTGAFVGDFTTPGAGGLASAIDFLFTGNGELLVTGAASGDRVLEFDASTGAFLSVFAQGNGLNVPFGMTIGPDGNLYVASTIGNSIKRFDLTTGAFLGDFVSSTAHPNPTYIQFTPTPIPEPTSVLLCGLVIAVGGAKQLQRRLRRPSHSGRVSETECRTGC